MWISIFYFIILLWVIILKHISVLIIEDSIYAADLNIRQIRRAGYEADYLIVKSSKAMKEALLQKEWDLIISDNSMPNFSALQALAVRNQMSENTPFVIVSEQISEEEVETAFRKHCMGYVSKENLSQLRVIVSGIFN